MLYTETSSSASGPFCDTSRTQFPVIPVENFFGFVCTGHLPGLAGKFQQVAILGPTDFIGEVVASKHKFTAVAECQCDLLWLKPQELHMLGSKSLSLAMQYTALREQRWQQQQQQASALPDMHYRLAAEQQRLASTDAEALKRRVTLCQMHVLSALMKLLQY